MLVATSRSHHAGKRHLAVVALREIMARLACCTHGD